MSKKIPNIINNCNMKNDYQMLIFHVQVIIDNLGDPFLVQNESKSKVKLGYIIVRSKA